MRILYWVAFALLLPCTQAMAQPVNFKDKSITLIVPSSPGGGTDGSARLLAQFIGPELPGNPTFIVRNIPGADGITAMNYFVQQVAPDGLTAVMGSSTQSDPHFYRNPNSKFDPTRFQIIGGVGRGGTTLLIRKDALPRLKDPKADPVVMGSIGGIPRSGMQAAAWGIGFLGWNSKWVIGYRGTNDLMLALERGEIDMTATANLNLITKMLATGNFAIVTQSGSLDNGKVVGRPEFGDAPVLGTLMTSAIKDPSVRKAFDYWTSLTMIDKWLALPEGTPQPVVDAYRSAFTKAVVKKDFKEAGRKISEDFETMDYAAVEQFLKTLASAEPAAIDYMNVLLKNQGLKVGNN